MGSKPWKVWVKRSIAAVGAAVVIAAVVAVADGWRAFGHGATGARRMRMVRSPQWHDGAFENPQPIINNFVGSLVAMMRVSPHVSPVRPVPAVKVDEARLAVPPASGIRITWMGHSTMLVELDGSRILTDPNWSPRASPLDWAGPVRWYPPTIALNDLPHLDAVVISHDHYDHLDRKTLEAMKNWDTVFVVPLGVGAHLEYWGIPVARIVELDWWEHHTVGTLDVVCAPARHASGRFVHDKDATLWASYAFVGPVHRVYYSGDTGLFPGMREIGTRLGPFDTTMIETGQYHAAWPDWHLGPEQAVQAHQMLRGRVLLPVHWGLLALAAHGWTEPVERVLLAAQKAGVTVMTPRPGESAEPVHPEIERWWPALAWQTSEESPVVSSQMDEAQVRSQ